MLKISLIIVFAEKKLNCLIFDFKMKSHSKLIHSILDFFLVNISYCQLYFALYVTISHGERKSHHLEYFFY